MPRGDAQRCDLLLQAAQHTPELRPQYGGVLLHQRQRVCLILQKQYVAQLVDLVVGDHLDIHQLFHGQLYADLSAAITAAGEGGTVKLMRSKTFTDDMTVSNNVTIDLNGKEVVFEGEKSMKIDSGKTMTLKDTAGDGSLSGVTGTVIAADGSELNQNNDGTYTVRPAEQQPTPPRYYYNSTTTTTKDDTKTSSPKTFDAGIGIYAVTAVLSVTGMAWTA